MGEIATVKVKYEGGETEVEVKPCDHCQAVPTEEVIKKAVAHDRKTRKGCSVCGVLPNLAKRHGLYHSVGSGEDGWILCGPTIGQEQNDSKEWISISAWGPPGRVEGGFHIKCLKKVAPGVQVFSS